MGVLTIKRGSSFSAALTFDGVSLLSNWATLGIQAQVRDPQGNLVEALVITKGATPGQAHLQSVSTNAWPFGMLRCDLRLVSGMPASVDYSETFSINVVRPVTVP